MRYLLTYFYLILFLFPMTEKGLHAFEHEEEEHCAEYEETHLHEKHHDCSLCDFNTEPVEETNDQFKTILFHEISEYKVIYTSHFTSYSHSFFSLRAPPSLG